MPSAPASPGYFRAPVRRLDASVRRFFRVSTAFPAAASPAIERLRCAWGARSLAAGATSAATGIPGGATGAAVRTLVKKAALQRAPWDVYHPIPESRSLPVALLQQHIRPAQKVSGAGCARLQSRRAKIELIQVTRTSAPTGRACCVYRCACENGCKSA